MAAMGWMDGDGQRWMAMVLLGGWAGWVEDGGWMDGWIKIAAGFDPADTRKQAELASEEQRLVFFCWRAALLAGRHE